MDSKIDSQFNRYDNYYALSVNNKFKILLTV